ncbi:hypothetical protein NV379_15250 [Paenibacillus sp. N1-5-1-14]|uniref:hypothetical protein n=1 Tax=Paenibacillus radicibacter TaxID=2972488 RepID=UPI002158FC94|nr:hypothetical protein [Paenibacillus radicibacter]MCR8644008.1 hypothetical protein [Paenibacillus radicibacter]
MKKHFSIIMMSAALGVTLSLSPLASYAYAADGAETTAVAPAPNILQVTKDVTFEVKQVQSLVEQGSSILSFVVSVVNSSDKVVDWSEYRIRATSSTGHTYTAQQNVVSKDKNKIASGTSRDISYSVKMNEVAKPQDVKLDFIKWDFSKTNFESAVGTLAIDDTMIPKTASQISTPIQNNELGLIAAVTKFNRTANEKYYSPSVTVEMKNLGSESVDIPDYKYSIRTAEGIMYPLDRKEEKAAPLRAKDSKTIMLTGQIPIANNPDNWELVMTQNVTELKRNIPVLTFSLPEVAQMTTQPMKTKVELNSSKGQYSAMLSQVYRLPWEGDDIVTAEIVITNEDVKSLPIPSLSSNLLLDDSFEIKASVISSSKAIGLAPRESIKLQVTGKIPYTTDYKTLKLVLQEKGDGDVLNDLVDFSVDNATQSYPIYRFGDRYTNTEPGHQTKYQLLETKMYQGLTRNVIMTRLEVENSEKRQVNISNLVGNFMTTDGGLYPAQAAPITSKLSPNNKAVLEYWSYVPTTFNPSSAYLLIGDGVTAGKLSEAKDVPDSFINPVAFWLPEESTNKPGAINKIVVNPYTLTFKDVTTTVSKSDSLQMKINYDLIKDMQAETNSDGHKLILEFRLPEGNQTFEKSFAMKDLDASDADPGKLKVGKNQQFQTSVNLPGVSSSVTNTFILNLYDEFQGQRKLIGTQAGSWDTEEVKK